MAVNKVVLGEDTLIDLTADTVSADKLSKGVTAHNMAGEPIVGTMEAGGGASADEATIITNAEGKLETTIGGKWVDGKEYKLYKDIKFSPKPNPNEEFGTQLTKEIVEYMYNNSDVLCSVGDTNAFTKNKTNITMSESNGTKTYTITFENNYYTMTGVDNGSSWSMKYVNHKGGWYGLTYMTIYTNEIAKIPSPLNGKFVPVDDVTIKINENGNVASAIITTDKNQNFGFGDVAVSSDSGTRNVCFNIAKNYGQNNNNNFLINRGEIEAEATGSDNFVGGSSDIFGVSWYCFVHGSSNSINGTRGSFAMGNSCTITGDAYSSGNMAVGDNLRVVGVSGRMQYGFGKYNILNDDGTYAFIYGNGTSNSARSNAYTLDWQGNGTFAGTVSSATGADYAEYFEWKDGNPNNEDRVGYIVTLDGDKIVKANTGDDILGICSGTAMVLGDSAEWNWSKRYLTDDFGRIIYEDYDVEHEAIYNPEGELIEEAWTEHIHAPKQNPDYDASQPYVKRADRPEWQIVGMMGKIYVRDDGSCIVNGYADVKDGIATKANGKTNMRVMERVTDNIVRVLMK